MIDKKRSLQLDKIVEKIEDLDQEELDYVLEAILQTPLLFSIPTSMTSVVQDDCDGDKTQTLDVLQIKNGDMCIQTNGNYSLRFRTPLFGGGRYPLVWAALRLLSFSIHRSQ
ncbi:MAG TPA: hypothetical protein VI752_01965 [Candidatus Paceibacterota bacterium]